MDAAARCTGGGVTLPLRGGVLRILGRNLSTTVITGTTQNINGGSYIA
jgi:hypothetical protein